MDFKTVAERLDMIYDELSDLAEEISKEVEQKRSEGEAEGKPVPRAVLKGYNQVRAKLERARGEVTSARRAAWLFPLTFFRP